MNQMTLNIHRFKTGILLYNTYKPVLITDGTTSFIMYNYGSTNWLTDNSAGGVNRQGGTMATVCIPSSTLHNEFYDRFLL